MDKLKLEYAIDNIKSVCKLNQVNFFFYNYTNKNLNF